MESFETMRLLELGGTLLSAFVMFVFQSMRKNQEETSKAIRDLEHSVIRIEARLLREK